MAEPIGSPLWWVDRLKKSLDARRQFIDLMSRYYEGDHPLPIAHERARQAFVRLLRQSRANWTGLVVDATAERLHVEGFRLAADQTADDAAWGLWQANELDADSELVHNEALVCGESYVTVWANPADPEVPLITPEHPAQMIVEPDRMNRRVTAAALKVWQDDWSGGTFATLYLPDGIWKFFQKTKNGKWEPREDFLANPLGQVPVVAFRNRARLLTGGRSEIADVTDIQDRINKTLFDRLMAGEYASFRQRWATGLALSDDADGNPVEPFNPGVDRLWIAEDDNVEFGEFSATDLTPYIRAVESDVQQLAAISRTPPHYLLGEIVNASGDALKAAEAGLAAKARSRTRHFGEAWEKVIQLAFMVLDDPRGKVSDGEVLWRDVETRTEGERVDALVKMRTLGVPLEALWARWGASPQEIEQWKGQQVAEALRSQAVDLGAFVGDAAQ